MFNGGFNFKSSNWVIDGQTGGGAANDWAGNFGIKIVERGDANPVLNVGQDGTANNISMPLPSPFNVDALGILRGVDGVFERGPFEFVTGAATLSAPTGLKAQ